VYIHKMDERVMVDIFPLGHEMDDPIASTDAFFDDGRE